MSDVFIIQMSIGDTLSDTYHMTPAEMGAYMRLYLAHCKLGEEGLPANDARLARLAGVTNNATWTKLKGAVMDKFDLSTDGSRYTQKRVLEMLKKISAISSSKRANVMKRWESRDTEVQDSYSGCNTTPTPTPTRTQRVQTPTPSTPASREAVAPPAGGFDKSKSGGSLATGFDVAVFMTDQSYAEARANADGWDIYRLMEIYNAGVRDGTRERPKAPAKAFPAWCAKYTKGKRP